MVAQQEGLPNRHVLTVPAMGSAVRLTRETTDFPRISP